MIEERILEGNKLIAMFMGYKIVDYIINPKKKSLIWSGGELYTPVRVERSEENKKLSKLESTYTTVIEFIK